MISDKIENLNLYKQIPEYALTFIKDLKKDIPCGKYTLINKDYANIEIYNTKSVTDAKFESHKNYIDIQLLLSGTERIYIQNSQNLNTYIPYDEKRDIEFYSNDVSKSDFITLDTTNFVMLYPHEAHAPQVGTGKEVKKVVIKLEV